MLARLHRGGHACIHPNSLAAMPHLCPLVHARGLHTPHHTTASFTHSIQTHATSIQTSSSKPPWCTLLGCTRTQGLKGCATARGFEGVVGRAKKARAHIHAQACGWARRQRKLTCVASRVWQECRGERRDAIMHSITRPIWGIFKFSLVSQFSQSVQLLPCVISLTWFSWDISQPLATTYLVLCLLLINELNLKESGLTRLKLTTCLFKDPSSGQDWQGWDN